MTQNKPTLILAAGSNLLTVAVAKSWPIKVVDEDTARERLGTGFLSTVGMPQTARLFSRRLGVPVEMGAEAKIEAGGEVLIGRYDSSVCNENADEFPDNAEIEWFLIKLPEPINYCPPERQPKCSDKSTESPAN
jgi:hypothetical protein